MTGKSIDGPRRLVFARLDQQAAARYQPAGCRGGDPPQDVEAVRTPVERHPRLVFAGLQRQQPDGRGGNVRHVRDHDVDPTAQSPGQRLVEITFVHLAAGGGEVAPGAPHGSGLDVDGVQVDLDLSRGDGGAHSA